MSGRDDAGRGPFGDAPGDAFGDALGAPLDDAVARLRAAPAAGPDALARATAAALAAHAAAHAAARRGAAAPFHGAFHGAGAARGWRAAAWAAGVVAAVGLGARAWTGRGDPPARTAAAAPAASAPLAPGAPAAIATPAAASATAAGALDEAPRLVRFRLRALGARGVAVVGDFNRWDPAATPLAGGAGGDWRADVPLTPGRHAYAFVVDAAGGRRRVLDPAAPAERDPDFGGAHSVTVVGVAGAP